MFSDPSGVQKIFGAGWQTRLINGTVNAVHESTSENKPETYNSGGTLNIQVSVTIHQPVQQGSHSPSVPDEGRMGQLDGAFIVNNDGYADGAGAVV